MAKKKETFVFEGLDGKIYGQDMVAYPSVVGTINSKLRRSNSTGRWISKSAFSAAELVTKRGDEQTAAALRQQVVNDWLGPKLVIDMTRPTWCDPAADAR